MMSSRPGYRFLLALCFEKRRGARSYGADPWQDRLDSPGAAWQRTTSPNNDPGLGLGTHRFVVEGQAEEQNMWQSGDLTLIMRDK